MVHRHFFIYVLHKVSLFILCIDYAFHLFIHCLAPNYSRKFYLILILFRLMCAFLFLVGTGYRIYTNILFLASLSCSIITEALTECLMYSMLCASLLSALALLYTHILMHIL